MEIKLTRLNTQHELYTKAERLLEKSFCPDERRSKADLRRQADSNCLFGIYAILSDDNFVGVISEWNFGKLAYIEHLAIEESQRSKGLGSSVLSYFKEKSKLPIIIEVEPIDGSEEKSKRINFYERNGFRMWKTDYVQPPYGKGKNELEMKLMGYDYEETSDNVDITKALLRKLVYNKK